MAKTTPQTPSEALKASIDILETDNGKSINAKVGDVMALRLHENASTGYRWAFDALDEAKLGLVKSEYLREGDAKNAVVGSGGDMTWTLKAKAKGTTQIKLKLWRSFEGDKSIQQRFTVTLKIR